MEFLDWFVLGTFFILLIGIVIWVVMQKDETSEDYFLAGRNAGWIAIGTSIFASNIGSEHLVGLAGAGAANGMAMAHWEMQGWIILVLGWVFVPFYDRIKILTMPEYLEKRFSTSSRTFLSVISLVSYVLTKVAVTVYAGGVVFKEVFGIESFLGIDFFWIGAIGLVVITGLFTVFGGMKAVLYTSVLQTPILLIGSLAILFIGLDQLGGWGELMRICSEHTTPYGDPMTSLMRSSSDPDFPWTGVILGSAIIGFWYWCTDQYIVQRVLSGKDVKNARRGTIFGAYLKLLPIFIFLIPGMIAFALHQKGLLNLTSADAAFSIMVSNILPVGLKGVVVGGIIAALMSSLASLFNSSAMLFTVDFYQKIKPDAPEKELVTIGRIATVVIVILGVLWIPVMKSIGSVLYAYLQDVQSLLAPGIAAVFLLGVLWRKTTAQASITGLVTGFVIGMSRLGLKVFADALDQNGIVYQVMVAPNWLHFEIALFFLILAVMIIVTFATHGDNYSLETEEEEYLEQGEGQVVLSSPAGTKQKLKPGRGLTVWDSSPEQKEENRKTWDKWDVVHSIVIVAITLFIYIYFF
ncbi:sodium:solute symporter [Persicobacter diffluens]